MFNTLGNIAINPRTGLLFVDFEHGSTLQLTGEAKIIWDEDHIRSFAGAERLIEFHIERALEITNTIPFTFELMQYSPFNL